ncbi:hypothetical protein BJ546DRAFT_433103 [Cryomyces antarcticus]
MALTDPCGQPPYRRCRCGWSTELGKNVGADRTSPWSTNERSRPDLWRHILRNASAEDAQEEHLKRQNDLGGEQHQSRTSLKEDLDPRDGRLRWRSGVNERDLAEAMEAMEALRRFDSINLAPASREIQLLKAKCGGIVRRYRAGLRILIVAILVGTTPSGAHVLFLSPQTISCIHLFELTIKPGEHDRSRRYLPPFNTCMAASPPPTPAYLSLTYCKIKISILHVKRPFHSKMSSGLLSKWPDQTES